MSWSVSKHIGKPEAVKAAVEPLFDQQAKNYEGRSEEQDVLCAKRAVCTWLDECACSEKEGVTIEANGSRGQGWVSITVTCSKVPLLL